MSKIINKKIEVYFLGIDVKPMMAGIELSALNRSKVFCDLLELNTTFLTIAFNNQLNANLQNSIEKGRASPKLKIESLYDYFYDLKKYKTKKILKENLYFPNTIDINNTNDFRVYDENGEFFAYGRRNKDLTINYVNYINNGRVIRRETFDSRGFVCRTEIIQEKIPGEDNLVEIIHTCDSKVAIIKQGSIKNNFASINTWQILNTQNNLIKVYKNEKEVIDYWLEKRLQNHDAILIIDRPNELFESALKLKITNPKLKLLVFIHGVHTGTNADILGSPANAWYKTALFNIDKIDGIIVLTKEQKNDIEERFIKARNKVFYIPHAIPAIEKKQNNRPKRNLKKIVYVARFSPEKKHIQAIDIFIRIQNRVPDAELHLYGFGLTEKDIRTKIQEANLQNRVFIHEFDQDIAKIYSEAGLSILTSTTEGFCMGVLESLSYACPVVSFNIKYGPATMIIDKINGELIEPFNTEKFSESVINILEDRNYHNFLIDNCTNSLKEFDPQEIKNKWIEVLKSI